MKPLSLGPAWAWLVIFGALLVMVGEASPMGANATKDLGNQLVGAGLAILKIRQGEN